MQTHNKNSHFLKNQTEGRKCLEPDVEDIRTGDTRSVFDMEGTLYEGKSKRVRT
jgi:hypothetical protein